MQRQTLCTLRITVIPQLPQRNEPRVNRLTKDESLGKLLTNVATNKRLTSTASNSYDPAIAVDCANIYVVWYDDTPGNFEIYFKKGIIF